MSHHKVINNRGYTLIEMTIVLMIITVVLMVTFGNMKSTYDAVKRNEFIYLLQQDLFYAQQRALSHYSKVSIVIHNSSKDYVIRQGGKVVVRRQFDDNINFKPGSLALNDLAFLHDGNSSKSGTLIIKIDNYSYRLVFLLGRGRFYLEQF